MKKTILAAAVLLLGFSASGQQALGPGSGIVSPEINPDHSVTFRLRAPKAITVQLTGDFLPTMKRTVNYGGREMTMESAGIVDLKEGQNGIWEYTSAPLEGELYSYSFLVRMVTRTAASRA